MPNSRILALLSALLACTAGAAAQAPDSLPFGNGERLTFRIRAAKLGTVGHAVMSLSGPVEVRGVETMLASFDASAGIPLFKGSDATRSWIDMKRMTSLRFQKRERRPFSSADDSVEIYPSLHHWDGLKGDSGTTVNDLPLDELSFIYFLRTLTLVPDSVYSFNQDYDRRRPPTTVQVVKHEPITTPAGEFNTVEYEVHMADRRDYKKSEVLHFWFSDGPCRLLVRVQSPMPILGSSTMTLESAVTPACQ